MLQLQNEYIPYVYIVIHREIVSLYHNSSVWLDTWDAEIETRPTLR